MITISFIVPQPSQVELVYNTYREHSAEYAKTSEDRHEYNFSVHAAATFSDVPRAALDADIIIARGIVASEIKTFYPHIAVVGVPIGGELVSTIYSAIKMYGRLPIGVSGSFNVIYSTQGIDDVLDADVKTYLLESNSDESIARLLDEVLSDGRRILVCGPNTYAQAIKRDCHPVVLGMSRESIWQAIAEAKHGAVIKRQERERAEQFSTVLNYAYEGILATDTNGRITVFNDAARDILHIPPERALGKCIDDIVPRGPLNSIFRGASDSMDKIVPYEGELLSVNKVSILLGGDFAGHVVTMQKSSAVQKTESKIRQQLYAKGHVARYTLDDIIGGSQAVRAVVNKARNFAAVSSNIMILGETGTGKEMFAQGIHNCSARQGKPFVAINCAALSKSLLESELFGYVEGAFTGAVKGGKPGIFEIAHTGTIFLDEISEIPLDLQGRLLRVLQERQIMRLGDDKIIPIDVRIISATNKPLLAEVRRNSFRRDLYYRLNVLTLHLPNLNKRGTDILRIAAFFIEEYCDRFQKPSIVLSEDACRKLMEHRWEGNIRELRNVCEYLVVLNESGVLTGEDLAEAFDDEPAEQSSPAFAAPEMSYAEELRRFDKDRITQALKLHKGDKAGASKRLGMSRTTLWRRMKELGIEA